jgi:ribonuclease HII
MPDKDSFLRKLSCTTEYEQMVQNCGKTAVAGTDKCPGEDWVGPTYAAACILPHELPRSVAGKLLGLKLLGPKKCATLAEGIKKHAIAWNVAEVSANIIDDINVLNAAIMAMEEAVPGLSVVLDFLLIDALTIDLPVEQFAFEYGYPLSVSVAAASPREDM